MVDILVLNKEDLRLNLGEPGHVILTKTLTIYLRLNLAMSVELRDAQGMQSVTLTRKACSCPHGYMSEGLKIIIIHILLITTYAYYVHEKVTLVTITDASVVICAYLEKLGLACNEFMCALSLLVRCMR